jgi:hypothetical protein
MAPKSSHTERPPHDQISRENQEGHEQSPLFRTDPPSTPRRNTAITPVTPSRPQRPQPGPIPRDTREVSPSETVLARQNARRRARGQPVSQPQPAVTPRPLLAETLAVMNSHSDSSPDDQDDPEHIDDPRSEASRSSGDEQSGRDLVARNFLMFGSVQRPVTVSRTVASPVSASIHMPTQEGSNRLKRKASSPECKVRTRHLKISKGKYVFKPEDDMDETRSLPAEE